MDRETVLHTLVDVSERLRLHPHDASAQGDFLRDFGRAAPWLITRLRHLEEENRRLRAAAATADV
jgi:hypothetical protein